MRRFLAGKERWCAPSPPAPTLGGGDTPEAWSGSLGKRPEWAPTGRSLSAGRPALLRVILWGGHAWPCCPAVRSLSLTIKSSSPSLHIQYPQSHPSTS